MSFIGTAVTTKHPNMSLQQEVVILGCCNLLVKLLEGTLTANIRIRSSYLLNRHIYSGNSASETPLVSVLAATAAARVRKAKIGKIPRINKK
jgi:hypothetical protein